MLRERLRPIPQAGPDDVSPGGGREARWLRYADLVKLGFSQETSLIVAKAPVPIETVTALLVPDGHRP